jgi:site-specific recombinase XerD
MIDRDGLGVIRSKGGSGDLLRSHIDGFVAFLVHEGYAPHTVRAKCELIVDLSRWLEWRKLPLVKLDEEHLTQFRISRHRRFGLRRGDMWTARQLLGYLRDLGCIPTPRERTDRTSLGHLTRDFARFLTSERGLSQSTVIKYLPVARTFLVKRFGDKAPRLNKLGPQDIHRFIVHHVHAGNRSLAAKQTVPALRSFFRFLHQRGQIAIDLAAAVPGVADWRLSHLPKSLPPNQVKQLLDSCDRGTSTGQRDHAILLLMARLGLRAGEVVSMTLDDLDWECGEIVVRGKGQKVARLPLPSNVGRALVTYLRHVRPTCSTRRVFIRMKAPRRGLAGAGAICSIVRRALKRAGLNLEFKGSHLLRHSLATNLLRRGASLTEIGQLLRHSEMTTTQIYAKVDIAALRVIALPWLRGAL